jgi:hypothetical protein
MSRLWKREMDAALERQAEFERGLYRDLLLAALNRWVASYSNSRPDEVLSAWVAWRNAAETLHRRQERRAARRLEMPLALTGMPRLDDEAAFRKLCGLPKESS